MHVLLFVAALATQAPAAPAAPAKEGVKPMTAKNPVVAIQTSMGAIEVELYPDKAPKTVENFLGYVKANHYDGTIFHRVIASFMIQGGGFDKQMGKKPTRAPVVNEAGNGLKNEVGTIAMARTSDPDSATAQFFINVKDNGALNRSDGNAGYCVFGKVVAGLEVVKKIEAVNTSMQGGMKDVPVSQVVIESVRLK
ncbi:MAG: peptidyl-prolyl cis-trans isomerase [Deltaproteobacteria bacterium]|nr:peptidyl-prolyl cis-trans isomerase [Deltaproteobacteria bacterium]